MGQGFQICSQSCKFSRVRVATVTHALKAKDLFMKYAFCMSLQEFFGQEFQICSQNCNFENKEIVRKKTLLQLYYNSEFTLKCKKSHASSFATSVSVAKLQLTIPSIGIIHYYKSVSCFILFFDIYAYS